MTTQHSAEKIQNALAGMNQRQKVTAIVIVVIVVIVLWQVVGLFRGKSSSTSVPTMTPTTKMQATSVTPAPAMEPQAASQPQKMDIPQRAEITKTPITDREAQLMSMQQELQAKYVVALNELQMLKVARDIAETNQAIMNAKLETISAEKKVVDLLSPQALPPPPSQASYSQGLASGSMVSPLSSGQLQSQDIVYTVISVSQLQGRWSAVIGAQGNLYSVHSGDVLSPDQSKVFSIDRSGVVLLLKDGQRKKISLMPVI
jgi:cell division protein FtsL